MNKFGKWVRENKDVILYTSLPVITAGIAIAAGMGAYHSKLVGYRLGLDDGRNEMWYNIGDRLAWANENGFVKYFNPETAQEVTLDVVNKLMAAHK